MGTKGQEVTLCKKFPHHWNRQARLSDRVGREESDRKQDGLLTLNVAPLQAQISSYGL